MSEWQDFPIDFLRRTMKNVESYQGKYETTNLINNCLGLIVIPNNHLIDTLPDYTFDTDDNRFGITKGNIQYESKQNYKLDNIVRHVRNGLSHGLIEQRSDNGEIVGLKIFDRHDKRSPINFRLELSTNELKLLAFSLAKVFLAE
jgi:HEPN pEK499 p136